jgi:hypothetical protein
MGGGSGGCYERGPVLSIGHGVDHVSEGQIGR